MSPKDAQVWERAQWAAASYPSNSLYTKRVIEFASPPAQPIIRAGLDPIDLARILESEGEGSVQPIKPETKEALERVSSDAVRAAIMAGPLDFLLIKKVRRIAGYQHGQLDVIDGIINDGSTPEFRTALKIVKNLELLQATRLMMGRGASTESISRVISYSSTLKYSSEV